MVAARNGHVEVVRVLLEGGADVQRVNVDTNTALHTAAQNGHLEVCRLLLDSGAKVDTVGQFKETALMGAASNGHLEVCRLLLDSGAEVNIGGGAEIYCAAFGGREWTFVAGEVASGERG
jgi:ankyrin repeat protein